MTGVVVLEGFDCISPSYLAAASGSVELLTVECLESIPGPSEGHSDHSVPTTGQWAVD